MTEKEIQMSIDDNIDNIPDKEIEEETKIDIKKLPELNMPKIGENVKIRIVGVPEYLSKKNVYIPVMLIDNGIDKGMFRIKITKTIFGGLLVQFKKRNEEIDEDMKCVIGKVMTIEGKEYSKYKGIDKTGKEWKSKIFDVKFD